MGWLWLRFQRDSDSNHRPTGSIESQLRFEGQPEKATTYDTVGFSVAREGDLVEMILMFLWWKWNVGEYGYQES
jgi:hypothetical protein